MIQNNKQNQHAGDSSIQYQANNQIIIHNGLTSEQATEIFQAMIPSVLSPYKEEAVRTAEKRIYQLEAKLLPRIERIEGALENFKDPAFQMQLRRAQMSAAVSDQESDWDMLSQLMIKHIEVKEDRNKKLAVRKAIEIISEIDNQALVALTVLYVFLHLTPTQSNVYHGLDTLESLYDKLLYQELPEKNRWIDHLEILSTITTYRYTTGIKINDVCANQLEGYATAGIKKESDNFKKAYDLLQSVGINTNVLIDNPLLKEYSILPIVNRNTIEDIVLEKNNIERILFPNEKMTLQKIFNLYDNGTDRKIAINNFIQLWDTYPALRKIHNWTDKIPFRINLNIIGETLAITNIKRIIPELKNLDIVDK